MFVKAKAIKLEVRGAGYRCSKEFIEGLSRKVQSIIKAAVITAKEQKMKTVTAEHIPS